MLTHYGEQQGDLYVAPGKIEQPSEQPRPEPVLQSSNYPAEPMRTEQPKQVDVDNMFHVAGNIFSSVFDGFQHGNTSKINRDNSGSNEEHQYNGSPLPAARFGGWK